MSDEPLLADEWQRGDGVGVAAGRGELADGEEDVAPHVAGVVVLESGARVDGQGRHQGQPGTDGVQRRLELPVPQLYDHELIKDAAVQQRVRRPRKRQGDLGLRP